MIRSALGDLSHPKLTRCLVSICLMLWCFIHEFKHSSQSDVCTYIILNEVAILIMVLLDLTSLQLIKNYANISRTVLPALIIYLWNTPLGISVAQTVTTINTIVIVFEDYQIFSRLSHILLAFAPYIVIQQLRWTQESANSKETDSFLATNLLVVFITTIAKRNLTKTIEENSSADAKHKATIQELEIQVSNLKESLEEKDNLMYVYAHEARNPMHVLLGNVSFLLKDVDSHSPNLKQMKAKLNRINFCAELLLKNLNNVLDSGKLATKGSLEITQGDVRIHEYLQSISEFMELLLKKNKLKPELIIPHPLPGSLKLDCHRLSQIILNLLTNAAKFTTSGSISLQISYLAKEELDETDFLPNSVFGHLLASDVEIIEHSSITNASEDPFGFNDYYSQELKRGFVSLEEKRQEMKKAKLEKKGFLKLEMNDTGSGMTKEQLQKLFQKFSQPNSDNSKTKIGTGLGLWIVKTLCELMEGGIRCYSKSGVGSSFVAIIRADVVPSRAAEGELSESLRQPSVQTKKSESTRVLLADGDESTLQMNAEHLRTMGIGHVETVRNGDELVERFKAKPADFYQVILANTALPSVSGIEAATRIREFEVQHNRRQMVKIGFWSAQSDPLAQTICQDAPINCCFYSEMPVDSKILREIFGTEEPVHTKLCPRSQNQRKTVLRTPQVLCVDDDLFNLDVLNELLTDLGARVLKAGSGEEALTLVSSGQPHIDLILLDCQLPGIDGLETSRQIKQLLKSQGRNAIPIVFVTGDARKIKSESEKTSEIDDVFEKPISREKISRLLEKYIK